MSLRLITDQERLRYDGEGYWIEYRRLPAHIRANIVRTCTKRGTLDFYAASIKFLEYCVLDWNGVTTVDDSGKEVRVDYDKDLVRYLPDEVQNDLIERIGQDAERLQEAIENLGTTPDSKAKTAG